MSKKAVPLPPHQLWELFNYDPLRGVFVWKTGKRVGKLAGCLNGSRRRVVSVGDVLYVHARLVWVWHNGPIPEGLTVDHIDRDTTNDRSWNLRLATPSQQQLNKGRGATKYDLPKGVTRMHGRYKAHIGTGGSGQSRHLGIFDTPEEAHAAYCAAAQEFYGDSFWRAN
jgi:hypothetical protein